MAEQDTSAFAAMRALRDQFRARLDRNEDYLAWKALDDALRQLDPPSLPKAADLVREASGMNSSSTRPSGLGNVLLGFDRGTEPKGP